MPKIRSQKIDLSRRDFLLRASTLTAGAGLGLMLPQLALRRSYAADAAAAEAPRETVVAETQFGKVRGYVNRGIKTFKAIPYGADTGGKNRFMPAVDPAPWAGERDALEYGPAAPQTSPGGRPQDGRESEDCLVLNVWTPALNDNGKRAVMFWMHGGGYSTLSGSSPWYDGTNLCTKGDVVVVTINHRLNIFGFTHLAQLGGEDFAKSGNVGMLDIHHALRWVKTNIAQFGGDPERVMIFGESGGGRKTNTMLAMPNAKGLFHRAASQSGAALTVRDPEAATRAAQRLLTALNVPADNVRKIQEATMEQILTASAALRAGAGPVLDPIEIPKQLFSPVASDVNPDVPLIAGNNRTEATLSAPAGDFSLDEAGMRRSIGMVVGEANVDAVAAAYRKGNPKASPSEIAFLVRSDQSYVMPGLRVAERRAALGKAPSYHYYFCWNSPIEGGRRMSPHSLEIPFVFDNTDISRFTGDRVEEAKALGAKVSATWIAFAKTGNPNAGTLPEWKPFDAKDRYSMVINDESQLVSDPIVNQRTVIEPILNQ